MYRRTVVFFAVLLTVVVVALPGRSSAQLAVPRDPGTTTSESGLAARTSEATIRIANGHRDVTIYLDSLPLTRGRGAITVLVAPGEHTVSAQRGDTLVEEETVVVRKGQSFRVHLGSPERALTVATSVAVKQGARTGPSDIDRDQRGPYSGCGGVVALRFRTGRHVVGVEGGKVNSADDGWSAGGFLTYHFEIAHVRQVLSLAAGLKAGYWRYPFGWAFYEDESYSYRAVDYQDGETYAGGVSALIGVGLTPLRFDIDYTLLIGSEVTNMMLIGIAVDIPSRAR